MGDGKTKSLWRGGLDLAHRRILPMLLLLGGSWALSGFVLLALSPSPAHAAFGFESLSSTFSATGGATGVLPAGSHPESWSTTLAFNAGGPPGERFPEGALKDLHIELPPGLVAAPALLPQCSQVDFLEEACPPSTAVGTIDFVSTEALPASTVFLLEPIPGEAAQLGFRVEHLLPVTIDVSISPRAPYGLTASIANVSQVIGLFGSTLTLEGTPSGSAFLTMPRSCAEPLRTNFTAFSWQDPAGAVLATAPEPQSLVGCDSLAYSPSPEVAPTTTDTASPSGIDLTFDAPDPDISSVDARAAADTQSATLNLPPGLTINPPVAAGLTACTAAQLTAEAPDSEPGQGCPEASKLGSATVAMPLFSKPIAGSIYLGEPEGAATAVSTTSQSATRFALYLVFRDAERGVLVDVPLRVDADPQTGQLTASLDPIPQLPISHVELHFNSGPRAPLTTAATCGSEAIAFSLTPSSGNPPLNGSDSFVTSGPDCSPHFAPSLSAGPVSRAAGRSAAFVFELSQSAASPNPSGFTLTLPLGLAAAFGTASLCPDGQATSGDCPSTSKLGYARIALGSGPEPLWVPPGEQPDSAVYLAGPYKGAPYSLAIVVPAQAGPFDLGTVVLRAPIAFDSVTAQASLSVEGLPQILDGVPLHYRTIRVVLDRPGFIRNPTSCEPTAIAGTARAADGSSANISDRFQASDCALLRFRPKLSLSLSGRSRRGAHPGVHVTLRPRPGDANMSEATVTLPPTELLDDRHVKAVCPADRFATGHCPKGALVGRAEVWTALLGRPLEGNIYLLSSAGRLPMLATSLEGEVHATFVAKVDSVHRRLRFHLANIPDVPLEKATLDLFGGKRGVIVDSGGVCSGTPRVDAFFTAQNGRTDTMRPRVASRCAPAG
jgi:hypothetical protein